MPSYEEKLTRASHIEISAPPKTEDDIGHGDPLGIVKLDIQVRDGSI